ncbi:MAG TPA: aminotransferase class III-fold pyridoxal phosphate-dependent enzyme [Solirubrobacteraceae bacterium]
MPPKVPSVQELLALRAGDAMALNDRYLNPQLGRIVRTLGFDREWTHGEGAHLIDSEGQRYLDLLCGYGTFAVGRNHPDVIAALRELMDARTGNLPQLGVSLLPGVLAEALVARAPERIVAMVTANTGTEAVEGAIKLARAATGRPRILYATHAFHGLTLGSLSLNGDAQFRDGFGPLLPDCTSVPFGDLEALRAELNSGDVAAFIVEPIQGKGVNLPPEGYLQGAQRACRESGSLFVCDEVQTGIGRTGRFFALEHWGLDPDMITVAKALSGGFVPIGGVLVSAAVRDKVFDGMERGVRHGSTFGGNDMAAAAGLATLGVIEREGLVERAAKMGELLLGLTTPLIERYEIVRDVRGMGLMWAIELGTPSSIRRRAVWSMVERAQSGLAAQLLVVPLFHRHQIFCQVAGHRMNVVKALPALMIEESEIHRFAAALGDVVSRADRMGGAVGRLGWDLARGSARALRR